VTARGAVLAIDHGSKRTGFAIADPTRIVVQPLDVAHVDGDSDELLDVVGGLLAERDVAVLLVGMPLGPRSGQGSERARATTRLCERLAERFPDVAVVVRDEHLTTKEAEARLKDAGFHGKDRRARRDSWSAWVLLADWIEAGEPR
jgi:putative Holliday junction resolvase